MLTIKSIFRISTLISVLLVIAVIGAGSIVRSTGAGMGCPDWPKCFGQWIPPTQVSQLPDDYQAIYAQRGYQHTEFNAIKTWTEYANRLLGMLVGFAVLINAIIGFMYWQEDQAAAIGSWAVLLLTGVQGWLGAMVVNSVLHPWMITIHMSVAILIMIILTFIQHRLSKQLPAYDSIIRSMLWIAFIITTSQFMIGSQVRQSVDELGIQPTEPLSIIGSIYWIHRSLAWLVAGIITTLVALLLLRGRPVDREIGILITICILIQMSSGFIFNAIGLVPFIQPAHLIAATILVSCLTRLSFDYFMSERSARKLSLKGF